MKERLPFVEEIDFVWILRSWVRAPRTSHFPPFRMIISFLTVFASHITVNLLSFRVMDTNVGDSIASARCSCSTSQNMYPSYHISWYSLYNRPLITHDQIVYWSKGKDIHIQLSNDLDYAKIKVECIRLCGSHLS